MGYGQSDQDDVRHQQVSLTVNTGNVLELPTTSSVVASKKVTLSPTLKAGLPIFTYCLASIVMTVTNKYVVSGDFNMVFLLLTVQVSK
jgi:GDP-mannose transporter